MPSQLTKLAFHIFLHLQRKGNSSTQGYVLFLVMSVMLGLQALLMAYIVLARIERNTTDASVNSNTSFYVAEGGLNLRAEKIRQKFLEKTLPDGNGAKTSPTSTADCLDDNSSNDGNGDFQCAIQNIAGKKVTTFVSDLNNKEASTQKPIPRKVRILPGELFEDLDALEYRYKIVADAQQEDCAEDCAQEAKQEMLIKIRNIPLFQFAAFYKDDMEFHPGSKMVLSGPVHSNSNIYFGAQQADPNNLKIVGQVSAVGNAYSRRKSEDTTFSSDRTTLCKYNSSLPDGEDCRALYDPTYGGDLLSSLDSTYIRNRWGNRIKVGVKNIKIPEPSFLNTDGDYYKKADLRIEFKPTVANIPFAIESIRATQNNGLPENLSTGQLQSLRQPVITNFCNDSAIPAELTSIPNELNTPEKKEAITKALKVSISSIKLNQVPLKLSESGETLDSLYNNGSGKLHGIKDDVINALGNASDWNNVKSWTVEQVVALRTTSSPNGSCLVASPVNVSNFYNSREDRLIKLLHINMASLTIWNKDGIYVQFSGNDPSNNNSGNGFTARETLFDLYDADKTPSNGIQGDSTALDKSFQKLGYAASDRTDGGLAIHARVDVAAPDANTNQSPYGLAIANASELPGLATTSAIKDPTGLTIASDQAIYLQGNYNTHLQRDNNIANKQPAAILADSINVLSNACVYSENDNRFSCGNGTVGSKTTRIAPDATETTINSAFLAGTDLSNTGIPNGGLHNYPRLHEDWQQNIKLTYRGSMVSLGQPLHVSGAWTDNQEWAYINPLRDYNYDRYFDAYENLPPLTPNLVYLRQEVFSRKFLR